MTQTIEVPDDLYERLRRTASALRAPVEEVAKRALAAGLPPGVEDAPAAYQDDLRALELLDDEALWEVWRSATDRIGQQRHAELLNRRQEATLTAAEQTELGRLREAADRLLLRRAHAAAMLRWRGHALSLDV